MKSKRVGIFADEHCGSRGGLAPENWWIKGYTPQLRKIARTQREAWNAFLSLIRAAKPIDIAIWNGDPIDGRQDANGNLGLVATDQQEQCDIFRRVVEAVGATQNFFVVGTPYHEGKAENFVWPVARDFGGQFWSHLWLRVNGSRCIGDDGAVLRDTPEKDDLVFDVKHYVGASQVEHGRHTQVSRQRVDNQLWALRNDQPLADVLVRSHVHYYRGCWGPGWIAFTTPALQVPVPEGNKHGELKCSGMVDWGFLTMDVENKRSWSWPQFHGAKLACARPKAIKA